MWYAARVYNVRERGSGGRLGARRRAFAAVLSLSLPLVMLPRTTVTVHDHSGGDRPHVHALDGETARDPRADSTPWDDFEREYGDHHHARAHRHGHHHHRDGQPEHSAATSTPGTAIVGTASVHQSRGHWHARQPYLRCLPSACASHTASVTLERTAPTQPPAPASAPRAVPLARGPPVDLSFPTFHLL